MGDMATTTETMSEPASSSSRSSSSSNQLFLGTFIHSKTLEALEYLHGTAVFVNAAGTIVAIERGCDREEAETKVMPRLGWDVDSVKVTECGKNQFFFPGFIDTHLHASQYPNVGIFGKSTLLDWLNTYTFPMEASLSDPAKARQVYGRCIAKTLAHGTTTAAYYATVDVGSTNLLADLCLAAGQRALVGRVCMDQLSPAWYRDETPEAAEAATRACIEHIANITAKAAAAAAENGGNNGPQSNDIKEGLIRPVITPRFAPSCTGELMTRLGRLRAETGLPVQTHISENASEIALVAELFPRAGDGSYAGVYDHFGLLGESTILAHAVHISEGEADLIRSRGSKISHCPCSNSAITSGQARVRWLLDRGIDVGLGTDMSGGYSPSVLEAARLASLVSRHVAMGGDDRAKLSVEEVLYLATKGGAAVVGLEGKVGGFEVGMEFDVQLVGLGLVGPDGAIVAGDDDAGDVDVFGWEPWDDLVAKWLFNGGDRNTKKVWVRGRLVHERKSL